MSLDDQEANIILLIKEQNANLSTLQQTISNYKKSPKERKTVDYIEKYQRAMEEQWHKFQRLDHQFRNQLPSTHDYFSKDVYAQLGEKYFETQELVKTDLANARAALQLAQSTALQTGPSTSKSAVSAADAAKLEKQKQMIATVQTLIQSVLANIDNKPHFFYELQLKTIQQHWTHAQMLHEQLWTTIDSSAYDLQGYITAEAEVNEGLSKIADLMKSLTEGHPQGQEVNTLPSRVKLPQIELPKFDGNYLQWRQFHDLFVELVHNSTLPLCQKMIYLKSSLSGEAKGLIAHFTTAAVNYEAAWKVLIDRYENKRIIVNSLLSKLLQQPHCSTESATSLKLLHDVTRECLLSLKGLNISTENWDPILSHILVQRLSKTSHALWEQSLRNPRALPSIEEFLDFLRNRFQSLEALQSNNIHTSTSNKKFIGASATISITCGICDNNHQIYSCPKFLKMTPVERLNAIQKARRCVNCLKMGHQAKSCNSSNCTKCHKKHNSLLHLGKEESTSETNLIATQQVTATITSSNELHQSSPVLLSTARVYVTDAAGKKHVCRALLDNGSQANFISRRLVTTLGIRVTPLEIDIEGIGQTQNKTKGRINIELSSIHTGFTRRIEVHILPHIVSTQPTREIDSSNWEIPANINLSDTHFHLPGRIDLLIGAGLFYSILAIGQISLGVGRPILQNTLLGWVVGGEYNSECPTKLHCGVGITGDLDDKLEKFWRLEDFESGSSTFTANEMRCERHFLQTIRRSNDGRFIVKLPFESNPSQLGDSRDIALQRFKAIERKLETKPLLRADYINFMREYEALNHMQEISLNNITDNHYFLPHHAVFKADSTTTKVRVVFDASAKTSSNYSLNDVLATGPTIQADVFTTILRFRLPRFAFTADIEKMYRQIWVSEADRKYQLIWWREDSKSPLRCMQLSTVTYGTTCAPYLATRVLQYIADTNREDYPLASKALSTNFYVDDVLTGADKITGALALQKQLREVLGSAGLHLRKWCANDAKLLQNIPEKDKEVSLNLPGSTLENIKTMGITWFPKDDVFSIKISQETSSKVTKRTALADISRLFDPLGLVAPVVVTAKIFLQQLWKLKLDWDAALPQELHTKWLKFRQEITDLQKISIARHIFNHTEPKDIQLHIFADASELAYGAAAYVRSMDSSKVIIVRLLCSKSRVAPVKQLTLPRLELCAAKLATDLVARFKKDHILQDCQIYFWTDSTAVLGWINASSSNYHTFVANRISAIQQISTPHQWHHVRSEQNPADLISRGLMPEQLVNNVPWFYGPLFLHSPMNNWPLQTPRDTCTLELRQKAQLLATVAIPSSQTLFNSVGHNNSLFRFQRIMAYVVRFINNCRHTKKSTNISSTTTEDVPPPSAKEMEAGLRILVKESQQQDFAEELKMLQQNKYVNSNSSISSLAPFIDEMGIIRVGGRLQASNLSFDAKHQMLLSYHHPLTKMLFNNTHRQHLHVGAQGLLSIIRQRFWPIKGKNIARATIQSCVFCTKAKPKLFEQLMGALPEDRVQPARPFITAGVDFFGPIWVHLKLRGKQPLKSYVALFCCFSTKAVHLELVSDLSTEAFLGALRRFMGRRGNCSKLYCDNATNFVGAKNQLEELRETVFKQSAQQKIHGECSKRNVEFLFIPPRAPHFGGLWEAAVKSAKHLLQSTICAAKLTREEMETLLIEAEAIMNSRPLTPMSSDPNDLTALTPGHFLIGEPLTSTADPHAHDNNLKPVARWKVVTYLKNEFWKRWTNEYLHTLQHRYKWKKEVHDIKPDTMVLIKEDNLPSLKWSLGRIKNVIRGDDGLIRVADVQTATNVIRRPITKLAPLPIENEVIEPSRPKEEEDNKTHRSKRPKLMHTLLSTLVVIFFMLPLCMATTMETDNMQQYSVGSASTITLILTCFTLHYTTSTSINFTPFQGEPGIYFERIGIVNIISSNWNLVNYVNLKPFWKELELANNYVTVLSGICNTYDIKTSCEKTINQIQQRIQVIESNSQLLQHHDRSKRAVLNLVGNIASDLFGLLDSKYAEKLSVTLENLHSNDELLKRHIENQTIFLNRTLNIMKRNQNQIDDEFLTIKKLLHDSENKIQNLTLQMHLKHLATTFNEVALQAYMQITRFESIQNALIDIITDAHHGRLSPELITPKELQVELREIDTHNEKTTKLPLPIDDVSQYYRVMAISHQITTNYVIFNIKIPLTTSKQFELLKLTAIPWIQNNTFVKLKLSTTYLITDLLRENHFALSDMEFHKCLNLENTLYLCKQLQPMYNHNSSTTKCEFSILKSSKLTSDCSTIAADNIPFWSALDNSNKWIYSVGIKELLNIVCDDTPSQMELSGSGLMNIEDGCVMKTTQVMIEGHRTFTKTRQVVYAPTWNISHQQLPFVKKYSNYTVSYHNAYDEINDLQNQLNNFKGISLNTIRPHDVHHYGLGYTVLFLVICCIGYIAIQYWKQRCKLNTYHPHPAPRNQRPSESPIGDVESQIIPPFNR